MPVKDALKAPSHIVDKFVRRHLEGDESVERLAKAFKISKATGYNWIARAKQETIDKLKAEGVPQKRAHESEILLLQDEITTLKAEVRRLREALMDLMVKHKEF